MARREEHPAQVRVAVVDPRRLLRQTFAIWLSAQEGVSVVGSSAAPAAISQIHRTQGLDVVVVGVARSGADDAGRLLPDMAVIAERHSELRAVAVSDDADEEACGNLLRYGFDAIIPSSAGAAAVLRVLKAGSVVRPIVRAPEASNNANVPVNPLTPRETEVLSLVGQGSTTLDISQHLGISRSTVANHKERIFSKLQAKNQAHAVARAVHLGLIASGRAGSDPRRAG